MIADFCSDLKVKLNNVYDACVEYNLFTTSNAAAILDTAAQ